MQMLFHDHDHDRRLQVLLLGFNWLSIRRVIITLPIVAMNEVVDMQCFCSVEILNLIAMDL